MNKVPEMISTKDLSYISDMLEWFIIASKKTLDFSEVAEKKEIKEALVSASELHAKQAIKVLNILNQGG